MSHKASLEVGNLWGQRSEKVRKTNTESSNTLHQPLTEQKQRAGQVTACQNKTHLLSKSIVFLSCCSGFVNVLPLSFLPFLSFCIFFFPLYRVSYKALAGLELTNLIKCYLKTKQQQ